MTMLARLLLTFVLAVGVALAPGTATAAKPVPKVPYCTYSWSPDHRLITVHGPEGIARIKVHTRHGTRVFREVIDEGTAVHLFRIPRRVVHVKARAFTDHKWHHCTQIPRRIR
jgi:hypothetical protein